MIRKILFVICLIVFCGSAYYLLQYVMDNMSAEKTVNQVAEIKSRGLDKVFEENSDLVGWIYVDGTKIDYPVMQTGTAASSTDDPEFYLHRDFYKESSASGTPFADTHSVIAGATMLEDDAGGAFVADQSTWNWLIYGHHMKFGTMFHDLMEFKDKDFWKDHKTFELDRIIRGDDGSITEADEQYEVVAACYSKIYPEESDAFKYYTYGGKYDEESFNEFIAGVKAEACYDTGVTAEYGDQLVTLSTCAYHTKNGRFYIVGKRITN